MMMTARQLTSDDLAKDLVNQDLNLVDALTAKISDELVARLAELAEPKIGRLTFHFAATKLGKLDDEVRKYSTFVLRQKFQEKRNYEISHKELPEEWSQHKSIWITYRTVLKGVARAVHLMKTIDSVVMGPAAKYLWLEMRKKRYELTPPPARASYMLLPHLYLSPAIRQRVIMEEMSEGRQVWSEMTTKINGQETSVSVCREWGAVLLGDRMLVLDQYPLQSLDRIDIPPWIRLESKLSPLKGS